MQSKANEQRTNNKTLWNCKTGTETYTHTHRHWHTNNCKPAVPHHSVFSSFAQFFWSFVCSLWCHFGRHFVRIDWWRLHQSEFEFWWKCL